MPAWRCFCLEQIVLSVSASVAVAITHVLQVSRDRTAVTLVGPSATPQQLSNGLLASCLYQCWARLDKLDQEQSDTTLAIIKPTVQNLRKAYERIVNPLNLAIRRDLGAVITKLHKLDLGKTADPMAGMNGA
ncbi:unnamed protein product, partial [Mycena citricolor]